MADDPHRGLQGERRGEPGAGPSRGPSEPLYEEEHEPTEKVDRPSITLHGVSQDAETMRRPRPSSVPPASSAAAGPLPGAAPGSTRAPSDGPVFVSMKPPSDPNGDRTEIVPAIERPDMRPRLRPVSEPPAWQTSPGALGHYAPPRPQPRRSWLWLYLVLTMAAALAGAGVTLWLRSIW